MSEGKVKSINNFEERYKKKFEKETFKAGPVDDSNRRCQDVICCLIFVAFLIGMVIVTILGFSQGNPNIILYPYDEDGRQCGFNDLKEYPYLYFYEAVSNYKDINLNNMVQGVCVSDCPSEYKTGILNCSATKDNPNCKVSEINFYVSTEFLGRFCVPDPAFKIEPYNLSDTITKDGKTYVAVNPDNQESAKSLINLKIINTDKLIAWISDLVTAWPIILASVGFSFVIIFIYMLLVRCFAEVIAYLTIILILAALAGLGYVFQARADYYKSVSDDTYELTMKVLCGLCYSFAGIWLLVVLFMCNRIRLAIALIKTVAEYLQDTCTVFFVPFIFYIISGCFYAYWVALSVYLYSSGEVEKSSGSFLPDVKWTSTTRYAWWFHLFALFYINAFLNAYNTFVLGSSACIWYWKPSRDTPEKPVYKSFYRAGRYHLGSLAFGSLIVAIVRFMIAILEYIKQKIDATKVGEKAGKLYKCLISCCQCCLNCCARCIEHINKHAYIQIALKGDSFCTSAIEGFGLVFRNLGRFSMLYLIGGFFNILGILFVSSSTGLIGYLLITRIDRFNDKLHSPVIPVVVMVFIGFIVGAISMAVYGTSGDAMMHCFLLDEEIHDVPRQSHPALQSFLNEEREEKKIN